MEPRYKQYSEDFHHINDAQLTTGHIEQKDGPKVYRLFRLLCLKDKVFNAFLNRPKTSVPQTDTKPAAEEQKTDTAAMELITERKLPVYTDTEKINGR